MADQMRGREHMSPRRVLVTGAFGFVGRWLIAELLKRDASMEIIGWRTHDEGGAAVDARVEPVAVDLTDRDTVFAACAAAKPTAVVHLAAISAPREAMLDPRRAWDVNLFGTMNLADAVLASAPTARFIHISSSEVYGGSFGRAAGALDETAALEPLNMYAVTKSAADLLVGKMAHEGLRAMRIRPFNHTGPGQSDVFVVASLASQIAKIERRMAAPVLYVGNTDVSRDILDVRDVASAYASAVMLPDGQGADVLNIASGRSIKIGEIAERLRSLAKVRIDIEVDAARVRANDIKRTLGDAQRAKAVLGWEPSIPIEETLKDVLDYWRERLATSQAERVS
ncbi:GDP-mannose 4,6-dehydratase [Arvimicrobium flavum]|uniref:GDP-mannose 4,6-dehydratase n=1 Tax=Arvimicrobium flavum TaxID=3393320 RepID=UPI00237C2391|nr:GDP-mannose 4,6-dehydratase [Mesorhizobium shangrilense]